MRYLSALLPMFLLSACQKVIVVKLDSSDTRYILTGTVTDQPGGCQVSITQSKAFSENNQFPGVSGATVTVEHDGVVTVLKEMTAGVYRDDTMAGEAGHTYRLAVHAGDAHFTASSTMPQPVGLDSIYLKRVPLNDYPFVYVVYRDPVNIVNHYRFCQYVNGRKEPSIFVSDDEFTDGQTVKSQLNYNNDNNDDPSMNITPGDSVRIEMTCIDAAVYEFWYSLSNGATGQNSTASPANPVSNITGGAIGYFSAQTVRQRTLIAP